MSGYAKIIADSISPAGHRLTTFEVRFRRFVLAEFNTHCVFDRNSASSRAIPVKKQLEAIERELAYPEVWPTEQPGMQGGAALSMPLQQQARKEWESAARDAVRHVKALLEIGVHKSVTNRLLEPFMMHTVCVTSTAYQNFFGLRANPDAQPEIRVAAEMMLAAYHASTPRKVGIGQWHLPYVSIEEQQEVRDWHDTNLVDFERHTNEMLVSISSARVARTSYLTQDGKRDFGLDVGLYDRLTSAEPMHASPLGQVATPDPDNQHQVEVTSMFTGKTKTLILPRYGKLLGWHAHRFDVEVDHDYQSFR
jgi:thymidylate synthase ThyX